MTNEVTVVEETSYPVGNIWTNEQRKDAAVAFVIHGNVKKVAEITGIPDKTIYRWVKADWWPRFLDEAKREHQELIEGRLSNILELATSEIEDRIAHGDIVVKYNPGSKEMEVVRVPVKAKDLGQIIEKVADKLRVIRNQPTKINAEVKFDADKLAKQFAEIADKNRERIVSEQ